VIVSQTGFTGEKGYEIYLRDATLYAEDMWNAVLAAGKKHNLMVIAPAHHRRIAAGILSWGQDIDMETLPFQCNLSYQVPRNKAADYVGKKALESARAKIEAGTPPYKLKMVGLAFGGLPVTDYAPDFWLVADRGAADASGYVSSPWYSPELETNIALAWVPVDRTEVGTELEVWLPDEYTRARGVWTTPTSPNGAEEINPLDWSPRHHAGVIPRSLPLVGGHELHLNRATSWHQFRPPDPKHAASGLQTLLRLPFLIIPYRCARQTLPVASQSRGLP
jgi:glycine cleavage system aminomethyltransferase T